MKNIIAILLTCLSLISCSQSSKPQLPSKDCIQLNDKGVDYLMKPAMGVPEKKLVDTAITFFIEALRCDSNYVIANVNLANAYTRNSKLAEALSVYDRLLRLSDNYPGFLVEKAVLYERLSKTDSAAKAFALALTLYNKKLSASPDNIDAIRGLVHLKSVTAGKDSAIVELDRQIKMHPKLAEELSRERLFYEGFK